MPDYTVQAPDGQTIKFHSDEELDDAHAANIAQQALTAQKSSPVSAPPGALETAGEHAAVGIGPGAAFAAAAPHGARLGAMAGAVIPGLGETGIPEIVGGVIGALATGGIASWAAYKAQHAALKATAPKFTEEMDKHLQTGEDAHPFAAVVGDVAGNLPSMEMEAPKLAQLPFRAALGATVGGVLPLAQGQMPTAKDIGEGALMGTVLGKSRFESAKAAERAGVPKEVHDVLEKSAGILPATTVEVAKTKIQEGAKSNEPEDTKSEVQRGAVVPGETQIQQQGNIAQPGAAHAEPAPEASKVPEVTPKLVPAIKQADGTIIPGQLGDHHADIIKRSAEQGVLADGERGFVDEQGKFLNRTEAAKVVGHKEPLHSQDLEKGPGDVAGPGGAAVPEELPGDQKTALKNASAEMERVGLGLEKAPETVRRNMAAAWVKSGRTLATDPSAGKKLASELIANPERGITDDESALLLRHKMSLLNALNDAAEKTHSTDPAVRAKADSDHIAAKQEFETLLDAIKSRGSEWGREGRWRQALTSSEYDFSSREGVATAFKASNGVEMTPGQTKVAEGISENVKNARTQTEKASDALNDHLKKKAVQIEDAEKKAVEAANKRMRDDAVRQSKLARKNSDNPELPVWAKAREYLNRGEDDFDDIRNKIATELGMSVKRVTDLLAQDKKGKYLADDLWRKQQAERRLKTQAKSWIAAANMPRYKAALRTIPNLLFSAKVFGHGTVILGTHAPMVAFQPNFWKVYANNFGRMYKMVASPAYYEMQVQDLLRNPDYTTFRRAGLINDPFLQEDYSNPDLMRGLERLSPTAAKWIGYISGMSDRGYSVLKILRQDMASQMWRKLPRQMQIPEMAKGISKGINHDTGVVEGKAPPGSNLIAFAPRLEASRVMWLVGDPVQAVGTFANWNKATPAEKAFAINQVKSKAYVIGTAVALLKANQGLLAAMGSNQKINFDDPTKSDFLKFKVAGMDFSYGNAMLNMARLPVRLLTIRNSDGGKLKHLIYPDESMMSAAGQFARTQLSPAASLAADIAFKGDYQNRPLPQMPLSGPPIPVPKRLAAQGIKPYTWKEFSTESVLPIPFEEAAREVWRTGLGMDPKQVSEAEKVWVTIILMGGTGGRLSEDIPYKKK